MEVEAGRPHLLLLLVLPDEEGKGCVVAALVFSHVLWLRVTSVIIIGLLEGYGDAFDTVDDDVGCGCGCGYVADGGTGVYGVDTVFFFSPVVAVAVLVVVIGSGH